MYRKVFISYAKEDLVYASDLYDYLLAQKYDPWLDKKKLLAGTNWELEIRKALKESDFIILLLSSTSVIKRGYVQREFKLALEYSELKLESDIYIIPILINDCRIPARLDKFQWLLLSEGNAYPEILKALNTQRAIYLSELTVNDLQDSHFEKSLPLDLSDDRMIESDIRFPQFPINPYFNAEFINAFTQNEIMEVIGEYCNMLWDDDFVQDVPKETREYFYFTSSYEIHYLSKSVLSVALHISYYMGGMHPNHQIITKNFSFNPIRTLTLFDVIHVVDFKAFLVDAFNNYGDDYLKTEGAHLTAYIFDVFDFENERGIDFLFNDKELRITPFNLLPHAFKGAGDLVIPLDELSVKIKTT